MLLENWLNQRIRNTWVKSNVQYFLLGVIIGTSVNIIFQLVAKSPRNWRSILMAYIVSVIITLCITNVSIISSRIIKKKFTSPFINIILNYFLILTGIIIGTEVSYLFVMLVYNIPFSEIKQWENLKINLTLGLVAGTIIYSYQLQRDNYNLKIKDKEMELMKLNELKMQADLKTLQARINPHFLYNALNSITSLIHDKPDKAEEMTIKLSQLFRYSINSQEANWTTVKDELEIVNTYLDIERVRFENRISFITYVDEAVLHEMIPRFLLQPLVENGLKHGLKNKSSDGILKISITAEKETIEINVFDNGIPFPDDLLVGYGLQSTSDKLNLLYGGSWKMNYINLPEKKISIWLPKSNKK